MPLARLAGAVFSVLLLAVAGKAVWDWRHPLPELDVSRYAVLSFLHLDSTQIRLVDGSRCQTRLIDAIARWDDVTPVRPTVMRDREARHADVSLDLAGALSIAAEVSAGRLVWGRVWMEGENTQVEGVLYDVASGAAIRTHRISIAPEAHAGVLFDEMADSLLVGQVSTEPARESAGATRSLQALRLYDDGHRSLGHWALAEAAAAFEAAADRDPGYAQASLWRSLVGLFRGEGYEEWRRYAAQAAREAERLSAQDRLLARGVMGLVNAEWQQACDAFGQALARDSLSFEAWLALGDCQARDDRVERDENSPSGWRFRSSYESAGRAYRRALDLAPSYASILQDTFDLPVERVFETRVGDYRSGAGGEADSLRFGGHPELVADTIAYVPWPIPDLFSRSFVSATLQATQHNRSILGEVTESWARAFPGDARALAAHARVLEATGRVVQTGDLMTSALDAVREARRLTLSDESEASTRLATTEVRLLVKLERFQEAAELADRVLEGASPTEATAEALAGLAVLRGRPSRAADLLETTAAEWVFPLARDQERIPVPLRETALRFLVFSAAGGPSDSLNAVRTRALRQAETLLQPGDRQDFLTALLSDAFSVAYTVIGRTAADPPAQAGDWLRDPLDRLAESDAAARDAMAFWDERIGDLPVAELPSSIIWVESHIRLALGDTVVAADRLDGHLESLRSQDERILAPDQAGPLVRSMALRATLADRAGNRDTARRWARATVELWRDGESTALDVVEAMSAILEVGGR